MPPRSAPHQGSAVRGRPPSSPGRGATAEVLLVQLPLRLSSLEEHFPRIGVPVAAGIRGVHLIHEHESAPMEAELVLGVHEDEAPAGGDSPCPAGRAPGTPPPPSPTARSSTFPLARISSRETGRSCVPVPSLVEGVSSGSLELLVEAHPRGKPDSRDVPSPPGSPATRSR